MDFRATDEIMREHRGAFVIIGAHPGVVVDKYGFEESSDALKRKV